MLYSMSLFFTTLSGVGLLPLCIEFPRDFLFFSCLNIPLTVRDLLFLGFRFYSAFLFVVAFVTYLLQYCQSLLFFISDVFPSSTGLPLISRVAHRIKGANSGRRRRQCVRIRT